MITQNHFVYDEKGCFLPQLEIWKPIKEYEGIYEISQYGRVRSIRYVAIKKGRYGYRINKKILYLSKTYSGYRIISFGKGNNKRGFLISRLVWEYFGAEPIGDLEVDHIIENNKDNNTIWNLQLLTHRENSTKSIMNRVRKNYLPLGVQPSHKRFCAKIWIDKKYKYIGIFDTPELAHAAYREALCDLI